LAADYSNVTEISKSIQTVDIVNGCVDRAQPRFKDFDTGVVNFGRETRKNAAADRSAEVKGGARWSFMGLRHAPRMREPGDRRMT
jgi:hypothetical protein